MSQTIDDVTIQGDADGVEAGAGPDQAAPSSRRADRHRRPARSRRWRVFRTVVVGIGLIALLFLAYLYSASFVTEARSQSILLGQFKASLLPSTPQNRQPPIGAPVGILQLPTLGLQKVLVQGVTADQTKRGPGHDPTTPLPGQVNNVVVIGRRSTYGAPFRNLDQLKSGDPIVVYTSQGRFVYKVVGSAVVPLGSTSVTAPSTDDRITLITANPEYLWRSELVVVGLLESKPLASTENLRPRIPGAKPGLTSWVTPLAPILIWGELFLLTLIAAGILYRVWRPVPAYVLTTPILVASLYLLFENLARLLPPSA